VSLSRRRFLRASAAAGAALWTGVVEAAQRIATNGPARGQLVRTVPLGRFDGGRVPPFGTLLGSGLDARQFTDLSTLTPETLVIPNDRFFIRTAAPSGLSADLDPRRWVIDAGGRVRRPLTFTRDSLGPLVRSTGTHLLECAGNSDPATYGLMSAARWAGVPIAAVLDRLQPLSGASRVCVTGVDETVHPSETSVPGASWIFSRNELERAGAFVATAMNDSELPRDHGFPARLVVPGWYGCACIKWVSRIDLVDEDEPATSQMREFARRTHQHGVPRLAREYEPAVIDLAAMPVRVEQWAIDGRFEYRVVGIMWGGSKATSALTIRFKHNQPFVRVEHCVAPDSTSTWSMWSHTWRPHEPGRYQIVLGVSDPTIRTRRLDLFFYTREVEIPEV